MLARRGLSGALVASRGSQQQPMTAVSQRARRAVPSWPQQPGPAPRRRLQRRGLAAAAAAAGDDRAQRVGRGARQPAPPRSVGAAQAAAAADAPFAAVAKGTPEPLGPSRQGSAINFALYSGGATAVSLVLHDAEAGADTELPMNKTGDVWHVALEGLPGSGVLYGFRVKGEGGWETGYRWDAKRVLLDPRAPLVAGRERWCQRDALESFALDKGSQWWGTFDFDSQPFDWGSEYEQPGHALKDLVIYEMSVRCFTAAESSGVAPERRGTYLGVVDKIPHLVSLGVNAVELLPVFEYDELELQRWKNPREHMVNVWGYSHMSFFSPMTRFGCGEGPVAAARDFKTMVKELHAAGIEVILDVVYNHTAELDDKHPYTISFRGIDSLTYYQVDPAQFVQLINYSGCGHTVNANHPVVKQLIIDSLVHWVEEYHVEAWYGGGGAHSKGNVLSAPPLIRDIAKHPVLSKKHLIAEPWDLGAYQVGSFPNWDVWAEWNGKYRDDIRRFIKGDAGMKGGFATRIAGSADLYNNHGRKPYHGINFVVAHDGFSLYDLVAYNHKHNGTNGEGNNDGSNDNFSWNCGAEGDSGAGEGVVALRFRQMRNFLLALMASQGVPMIVMGDEIAQTHYGNNNWYGHDNGISHMHWDTADQPERAALLRFASELIRFRRACPLLRRSEFLRPQDITWHEHDWANAESRFLAWTLHDTDGKGCGDLYFAFNAHPFEVRAALPQPPAGQKWSRVVDTSLPPPKDFTPGGNAGVDPEYGVSPFGAIMLMSKPA
ncbi:isoamylase-type starch debranching enzyme [Raphidocelis subcapitata]|uniref:isoamylase n=1 Tax=Raphidocelis subcapitata TaxID=307507 RepID=A0A2V0P9Q6_9CHLO|nr:isoamylase-type starch debranching enzyme [Raphidocelis subcapitata]|eukprot:GBF96584.1 isoamylase-type starch debranching enzyme [Raphidocelis subcapitata]